MTKLIAFFSFLLLLSSTCFAKNAYVVDSIEGTKTKIVRSGLPTYSDFQHFCKLGVRRMIVMSGNGSVEKTYAKTPWSKQNCAGFEVIYDQKQASKTPLSEEFLNFFDKEIETAKSTGVGVGFRCNCGCHRTGRLAAYYRMKYLNKSPENSVLDQRKKSGPAMLLHFSAMKYQIFALNDYISGNSCGEDQKYCVTVNDTSDTNPAQNDPDDQ